MAFLVDARGLGCPEPVILTKRAMEKYDELEVLVDSESALHNIRNLAQTTGFSFEVEEREGFSRLILKRKKEGSEERKSSEKKNAVIVICSDSMGRGDEKLGRMLMRAYIHALTEIDKKPDTIIFYNRGVLLLEEGSDYLDDLKTLEESGVDILVCGTCVNYFNLAEKIRAGRISNMYEIAERLVGAEKVVMP